MEHSGLEHSGLEHSGLDESQQRNEGAPAGAATDPPLHDRLPQPGELVDDASQEAFDQSFNDGFDDEFNDGFDSGDTAPLAITPQTRRRILLAIGLIALLGLMAVLPPLINVNRYRHRIANSIGGSLGRPVHIDAVSLTMLPMPGFVLTNFVVDEDPGFGSEPVMRANSVTANLRISSLWHNQVEFSKIVLEDPSVNLVQREDGRWNVESILLQASRLRVVPTEQKQAGNLQRFPYIEATGGRVNLKRGLEKMPLSLTEANFALWLPKPESWHLRLEAYPSRTDTVSMDSGIVKIEGTLGKADAIEKVPLDLAAEWSSAPMGAASWVILGRDAGLRGEMTLRATARGTVGSADITSKLELRRLRRAEFLPAELLNVNISCTAATRMTFHQAENLHCIWPTADGSGGLEVTGDLANLRQPIAETADLIAKWHSVPASAVLDAARAASQRIPAELRTAGVLAGELDCCAEGQARSSGTLTGTHMLFASGDARPFVAEADVDGDLDGGALALAPFALDLGGPQPALVTVRADAGGVHMRLTGTLLRERLQALEAALPQFGDGLAAVLPEASKSSTTPLRVDLVATRPWGGPQTWAPATAAPARRRKR